MKPYLVIFLCFFSKFSLSQSVEQYFESIRNNEAALTAFFSQMPKGGDLHHHYGGAIYAEPLLQEAIEKNFYINIETMKVVKEKPSIGKWQRFSSIKNTSDFGSIKQKILQKWSVKDYNNVDYPSDKLFFESFDKFWPAAKNNFPQGLVELKNRALKENISYIETQLTTIPCDLKLQELKKYNSLLRNANTLKDEKAIFTFLDTIYNHLIKKKISTFAKSFNINFVEKLHTELVIDDSSFTMRYQNFVLRFMEPVDLFQSLVLSFISADTSPFIVGVNIVSPEDGEISLQDYWLHMLMFKYCNNKFPNVKYSLHAGELTLGLVRPEELSWHINSAIYTAKANRIGHGVDIAYEDSSYKLLRYMAKNKIPVEINLASNEFILKIKENRHPILLYKEFGVPIVISSDDPGVLRTNMIEQYVLLAKRYKTFSYADIKKIIFNSIEYSFIEEPFLKATLLKNLNQQIIQFESIFGNNK